MNFPQRLFAFLIVSLIVTAQTSAQDSPAWRAVLLRSDADRHELVVVTDSGIGQPIPLPKNFNIGLDAPKLSPDGRYAAVLAPGKNAVEIADLQAGTCCQTLTFSDERVEQGSLAGFSPDSQQIAVAYLVEKPYKAEIVAFKLESGKETRFDAEPSAPSDGGRIDYAIAESWGTSGISYYMSCILCVEQSADYALLTWNPATGETAPSGQTFNGSGDTLALTGEQLTPQTSALYPEPPGLFEDGQSGGLPPSYNVIVMTGKRASEGRAVVYFDPDNLKLTSTRWVADGNAFLVFPAPGQGVTMLVSADAPPAPVTLDAHQFLTGTPDGWLALENGTITHTTVADGQAARAEVGKLDGFVTLVESTPLGAKASAAFQAIEPPRPEACPGGKQPRLTVGHFGRVTPGAANNVRKEPTTRSPIVGKIAGGEQFTVVSGPVCAQGLTWWEVQFNDITGWTAESNTADYWLEPVAS